MTGRRMDLVNGGAAFPLPMNRSSARCSRARPRPSSSSSNPSLRQKIEHEDEGRGTRTNSLGRFMAPMGVLFWRSKLPMSLAPSPHPSPPRRGRGCPPGRVRGWFMGSRREQMFRGILPMNCARSRRRKEAENEPAWESASLRRRLRGSWSPYALKMAWRLPMNPSCENPCVTLRANACSVARRLECGNERSEVTALPWSV